MGARTIIVVCLVALGFAPFRIAEAQQPKKVSRIGFLAAVSLGSRRFGRVCASSGMEGKNILIEWRYADGKPDRLPALAAELVEHLHTIGQESAVSRTCGRSSSKKVSSFRFLVSS